MDVIGYGDAVVTKGLNMLYGPGNDLVSATAMTAAGAHLILFTTGRSTPFGAPAPTLKLSTNSRLAENKKGWIDFDAGPIVEGESIDDAAKRLLQLVIEVANGKETQTGEVWIQKPFTLRWGCFCKRNLNKWDIIPENRGTNVSCNLEHPLLYFAF